MKGPPIFDLEVRNFALVTYDVPAERVARHLPDAYELETFGGPDGTRAFVTTTCFCNLDFRTALLPYPRHTFNESTYRTYVTRRGSKGVYFFGRYLGTPVAWSSQRLMARDTYAADFEVDVKGSSEGFESYRCKAASTSGDTHLSLRAGDPPQPRGPFNSGEEHAQFLTYRLNGYYTSSAGIQAHMPVEHPRMDALEGSLDSGRADLWSNLEIVSTDEVNEPFSVLVVPGVTFRLYAPRPIWKPR